MAARADLFHDESRECLSTFCEKKIGSVSQEIPEEKYNVCVVYVLSCLLESQLGVVNLFRAVKGFTTISPPWWCQRYTP